MNHRRERDPELGVPVERRGFTLVELLAVMTIIGIILVFILVASQDARRRAEERATQSLITKLDGALNDRLDSLIQSTPFPNEAHKALAAIYVNVGGTAYILPNPPQIAGSPWPLTQRAQVIATYDYIKSEMPDVFFLQPYTAGVGGYPLNFAASAYPGTAANGTALDPYILPLGNNIVRNLPTGSTVSSTPALSFGDSVAIQYGTTGNYVNTSFSNPSLGNQGSGIFGASYNAAAGLYKNLGYLPAGYDGVDNDQNGTVDDWAEGVGSNTTVSATVTTNLGNHTHNTARSEMLYALLVEGRGPLGSVFNRDDFTDREVQDTDGDGMPEFIDAWGQPLQFFRWPILYHSDLQRGQVVVNASNVSQYDATGLTDTAGTSLNVGDFAPPYLTVFEEREVNPLDQNQQLVGPGWWATASPGGIAANNNSPFLSGSLYTTSSTITTAPPAPSAAQNPSGLSNGALAFEYFFHRLTEPMSHNFATTKNSTPNLSYYWDRGTNYPLRRAFYSKFLVLSGGPDKAPGVFLNYVTQGALNLGQSNAALATAELIANENCALQFSVNDVGDLRTNATFSTTTLPSAPPSIPDPTNPNSYEIQQNGQDDISNHSLQSTGGIGGSG